MPVREHVARLLAALLLITLLPAAAFAQEDESSTDGSDRGPDAVETGTMRPDTAPSASDFATPLPSAAAERQFAEAGTCPLSFYPPDPDDQSLVIGVTPYHEIAPRLCVANASERVTVWSGGESVQGRELPMALVTAPESEEAAARDAELRRLMVDDPEEALAQLEAGAYDDYKPTLFANNNIHGNEWEGTDYSLDLIEYLSTADEDAPVIQDTTGMSEEQVAALPTVGEVLEQFRIVVLVTANPDGRVLGRRQNANFIDMNRDHITQSQPETVIMRDAIIDWQPLIFQDHHGYVSNAGRGLMGLIEPTTPPHGEAYEYDLYLPSALQLALDAEQEILRRRDSDPSTLTLFTVDNTRIPYRDDEEGWDDWPPIFTPMYAMYHAAVGATIEFPYNPRGNLDPAVRAERVRNNIEYGRAVLDTMLVFGAERRDTLLENQIEWFRRGVAAEPSPYETKSDEDFDPILGLWDDTHLYPTTYPAAYVIPAGDDQRSDRSAATLAQFLIDNDVRVHQLAEATTIGGTSYAAGSYVVDMRQAKRGLAHTILGPGTDISDRVDAMYDISGWSLGLLWGADVDTVTDGTGLDGAGEVIDVATPRTGLERGDALGYSFRLDSAEAVQALTDLWDDEVELQRTADGEILVPASARDTLLGIAEERGVWFARVTELPAERTALPPIRIAAAQGTGVLGASSFLLVRDYLGFDADEYLSASQAIRDGVLDDYDVLLTAEGHVTWSNLQASGQEQLRSFLDEGGALVSYGRSSALNLVDSGDLIPGLEGRGSRTDANGVLSLTTREDSEVLPGRGDVTTAFFYPLAFFPEPGEATVEQRLSEDPMISGHWRSRDGFDQAGQEPASGEAITVSYDDPEGGRIVAFGHEPLFRWHPRQGFHQVADAMLWAVDNEPTDADLGEPWVEPGEVPTEFDARIFGRNRIETAVQLSRAAFEPGVGTVVVATGYEFADALASGPLAGQLDGPVLLTFAEELPAIVAEEIERLQPGRIIIAGGTAAVSEAVEESLSELGEDVDRVFGSTRFGTAAAISEEMGVEGGTVFIATGQQFADALTGGVLAGVEGGSLLLVGRDVLPGETADELERIAPEEVVVFGGSAAVSDAVVAQIATTTGVVPRRIAGPDRWGTAAEVAAELDETIDVDIVFAATGHEYADALSGVPVAIREGGAILLVERDSVPPATSEAIEAIEPDQVVVLGGTGVISDAVLAELRGE
jgi:putative cell wall-binding protein